MILIRFSENSPISLCAQNAQDLLISGVMGVTRLHLYLGIGDTVNSPLPFLNARMKTHVLETYPQITHLIQPIRLELARRDTLAFCAMNVVKIMAKYRNLYAKIVKVHNIY